MEHASIVQAGTCRRWSFDASAAAATADAESESALLRLRGSAELRELPSEGTTGTETAPSGSVAVAADGAETDDPIDDWPQRCRFESTSTSGRVLPERSTIPAAAGCRNSWEGGVPGTCATAWVAAVWVAAAWVVAAWGPAIRVRTDAWATAAGGPSVSGRCRFGHLGEPLAAGTARVGVSTLRAAPAPAPYNDEAGCCWRDRGACEEGWQPGADAPAAAAPRGGPDGTAGAETAPLGSVAVAADGAEIDNPIDDWPQRCRFESTSTSGRVLPECSTIPAAAGCRNSWEGGVPGTCAAAAAGGPSASNRCRVDHIGEPLAAGTAKLGVSTFRAIAPPIGDATCFINAGAGDARPTALMLGAGQSPCWVCLSGRCAWSRAIEGGRGLSSCLAANGGAT